MKSKFDFNSGVEIKTINIIQVYHFIFIFQDNPEDCLNITPGHRATLLTSIYDRHAEELSFPSMYGYIWKSTSIPHGIFSDTLHDDNQ